MSAVPPSERPTDPGFGYRSLVELLSPALGGERSAEIVSATAGELRFDAERLNIDQTLELLGVLGSHAGVVGIAARLARTRLLARRMRSSSGAHRLAPLDAPRAGSQPQPRTPDARTDPAEIAALLAHTVGAEKSAEVVGAAIAQLKIPSGGLSRDQVLGVLELLAKAQGIVGIASRFAKARLILRAENDAAGIGR